MNIKINNNESITKDCAYEALLFVADHFRHFGYMPIEFEYENQVFDIEVTL